MRIGEVLIIKFVVYTVSSFSTLLGPKMCRVPTYTFLVLCSLICSSIILSFSFNRFASILYEFLQQNQYGQQKREFGFIYCILFH